MEKCKSRIYEKLLLPVVDITAVEASVTTSVILMPQLIRYSMDVLKASLSMLGDFKLTSRLSIVSICKILLLSDSITE